MTTNSLKFIPKGSLFKCALFEQGHETSSFIVSDFKEACVKISLFDKELLPEFISIYQKYYDLESGRLNHTGFESLQNELTRNIPSEITNIIVDLAYDQGHASGYSEILACLSGIAYEFNKVFEKYKLVKK